jgi:excinuclease ABC subunit A
MPGFPFMGDLPERLRLPRRTEPRVLVPPGSVAIASQGVGTISHLEGALFEHMAAVKLLHVPYKGIPPALARKLETLMDVGLSYVKLGQPATTLSGGEAQRVKLSKELSRRDTGRTLYILDEPTTGLHFADIEHLLAVLHKLRDDGNTVVVIEHNLDVVKTADWVIDLGPEGGHRGGTIVATGTPEQIAAHPDSHTGHFLAKLLEAAPATAPVAPAPRRMKAAPPPPVRLTEEEKIAAKKAAKKAAKAATQSKENA